MIVIVGDRPSSKNTWQSVPFVGTRSYKVLLDWLYKMNVDISDVMTCNSVDGMAPSMISGALKVIALGKEAEKVVKLYTDDYYCLPHPSPLNRKLNDEVYVARELRLCQKYLYGKCLGQPGRRTDQPSEAK